jgi:hypothetical protein
MESVNLMAFLVAFFDESGKWKDHKVISFCGLAADNDHWETFHSEWTYALRHNGIKKLHISEGQLKFHRPLSPKRPALGKEARLQVLRQFVSIIKTHLEYGIAFTLDVAAFNELGSAQRRKLENDPHLLVFKSAVVDLREYVAQTQSTVGMICDDEERYSIECYRLFSKLRTQDPSIRKTIVSFGFADDEYFTQLQAADLLAYVSRCEAAQRFTGRDFEAQETYREFTRGDASMRLKLSGYFWNKEAMEAHAKGMAI